MIPNLTAAVVVPPYKLVLTFSDSSSGTVDCGRILDFSGVFAPLRSPEYFLRAVVDEELGTVCWPNGADIDPLVLHAIANGYISETEFAATRTLPDCCPNSRDESPAAPGGNVLVSEAPADYQKDLS